MSRPHFALGVQVAAGVCYAAPVRICSLHVLQRHLRRREGCAAPQTFVCNNALCEQRSHAMVAAPIAALVMQLRCKAAPLCATHLAAASAQGAYVLGIHLCGPIAAGGGVRRQGARNKCSAQIRRVEA